jgi:chemotaxis protein methyltransferase CheR
MVKLPNSRLAQGAALPANTSGAREFAFSAADFDRVRRLIFERAGIALNVSKQSMVYSRLARRLRTLRMDSFVSYLDALEQDSGNEWEQFVNSLTTNLTSFYREAHHFQILTEHLRRLKDRSRIDIWCCASSTGEEPYTLAIAAMEAFGTMAPPVRILATDIDTRVLETARNGVYRDEVTEKLSPELLHRYFLRGNSAKTGYVRLRNEVMRLVTFRQLNLLDATWPISSRFSAIFCRNVMIYFDKATQYRILQRFVPLLESDGLLFAGHSENFSYARDLFESRGQTTYALASLGAKNG